MWPSIEGENTTPGMLVTAADWAGLHPERASGAQTIGGAYQVLLPSDTRKAVSPPPCCGSRILRRVSKGSLGRVRPEDDVAAYTRWPSVAMPHWTPTLGPTFGARSAIRTCHSSSPSFSGSNA